MIVSVGEVIVVDVFVAENDVAVVVAVVVVVVFDIDAIEMATVVIMLVVAVLEVLEIEIVEEKASVVDAAAVIEVNIIGNVLLLLQGLVVTVVLVTGFEIKVWSVSCFGEWVFDVLVKRSVVLLRIVEDTVITVVDMPDVARVSVASVIVWALFAFVEVVITEVSSVESTVVAKGSKVLVVAPFEELSVDGYSLTDKKDVME